MKRFYYSASIQNFCNHTEESIIGHLTNASEFSLDAPQREAWRTQISYLKKTLIEYNGGIFFEYAIPRMGKRIDVVLVIDGVIFVIEFKVGETSYPSHAVDQVLDYAVDLKNFHKPSEKILLIPILLSTKAQPVQNVIEEFGIHNDGLIKPILTCNDNFKTILEQCLVRFEKSMINYVEWGNGPYHPTPTIIEASKALYNGHSVVEITRSDAANINITGKLLSDIIAKSQKESRKSIIFITGVPGAGKTLVGLEAAVKHLDKKSGLTSVFLSGNGPLVSILREALTRDRVAREKSKGNRIKKGKVLSEVKLFIQNVHHFRDDCLIDREKPPFDHIAIFDEAQRAWNLEQTANFMKRKKGLADFNVSEPEFLISCIDRHKDWGVVICLVGGGQEINTGEAGITEWLEAIKRSFPHWGVYISNHLNDSEYAAGQSLKLLSGHPQFKIEPDLHLATSIRSFRAENLSKFIKCLLDLNPSEAFENYQHLKDRYPIYLTRSIDKAKAWLQTMARGTERYGIVVSSEAQRLRPYAIDVKTPVDPVHWFLDDKADIRSSYYLEDVVTEFQVQGLELDWTCVTWDGDLRYDENGWKHFSFVGRKWNNIKKPDRQQYLKNAYRVLLTRARQGMIIFIPNGDSKDDTRKAEYYDPTFKYLQGLGLREI